MSPFPPTHHFHEEAFEDDEEEEVPPSPVVTTQQIKRSIEARAETNQDIKFLDKKQCATLYVPAQIDGPSANASEAQCARLHVPLANGGQLLATAWVTTVTREP